MRKPRLFIASSVESLSVAEAVNVNVDHELEVTIWRNGTFRLSTTTIDDLVAKSSTVDFALFIFTPDDIVTIRSKKEHVVRDNVLFEMGLFIGAIGKERSFILKPRDEEMHLPTDLLGTTPADYDANRSDGDLVSATNRACALIKSEVKRIGLIEHATLSETRRLVANPAEYTITATERSFLASCLGSHTYCPGGRAFSDIVNKSRHIKELQLGIAAIKLERMGLVERSVATDDQDGYDYYSYSITELGIDELLRNEEKQHPEDDASAGGSDFSDNNMPF